MSNYKTCYKCKNNKEYSEFYNNKNMCKVCCREYARNYYYSKKAEKQIIEVVYVPTITTQKTISIFNILKCIKC